MDELITVPIQIDRWGLSDGDWDRIEQVEASQGNGLVPRLFTAVRAMKQEIDDAAAVLDSAGIDRGKPELGVGTRAELLKHQLDKRFLEVQHGRAE